MKGIYLEPMKYHEGSLEQIARWRNHEKVLPSLRSSEITSPYQQKEWVESFGPHEKYYYIREEKTEKLVGYCGLDKINHVNSIAEISLLIDPDRQRQGYGSQAVRILLDKAFNQMHLNTVFGEVYTTTDAPVFWSKCGFKVEATLIDWKWWGLSFWNALIMTFRRKRWGLDL
jgi:RimJ/RimL family protein N-acetyltransferase